MKNIRAQKIMFTFIITLFVFSCNKKNNTSDNSLTFNDKVAENIKEYYERNKSELNEEYVLKICSNKIQDTTILSISYSMDLSDLLKTHSNNYGYLDNIPFIYTSDEKIYKPNKITTTYDVFLSQVFKYQYSRYVINKENFPPPPIGIYETMRLFVYDNMIIRKVYDDNTIKGTHEISSSKRSTGNKKLDSLLDLK
jgi:hypothetical protein